MVSLHRVSLVRAEMAARSRKVSFLRASRMTCLTRKAATAAAKKQTEKMVVRKETRIHRISKAGKEIIQTWI